MKNLFRVACLQTKVVPSLDEAIAEADELARLAVRDGAKFLFLPEYCGGLKSKKAIFCPPVAAEESHPFLKHFIKFAQKEEVWVMIGSLAIEGFEGKYFNRGFIISDSGKLVSRYDKIHLFDITLSSGEVYKESSTVIAGKSIAAVETAFGKLGHTICYDLRFPMIFRELAQQGAEILAIPSAFTKFTGALHWHVLNRARAIENTSYVISPCATGAIKGGGEAYGHSLIVDPWGKIIQDAGESRGIVIAELDTDKVKSVRSQIPSLLHDKKFEIYTVDEQSVA